MIAIFRKGDAPSVQLRASVRVINRCRETKRINSVTQAPSFPQLRCVPVAGGCSPVPFSYELNVQGQWTPINYQFAAWLVDELRRKHRGESCKNKSQNSTSVTSIPTGRLFTSSDTTVKTSALFSCEKGMSMNASSRSGISKQNLRG